MKTILDSPAKRATFLGHLAATGFVNRAARLTGISVRAVETYRDRNPEFAAACAAARAGPAPLPEYRRWTPALQAKFLEVLAETGNAARAARETGLGRTAVGRHRVIDPAFASAWAQAIQMAADRVEDRLFDIALNGIVATRTDAAGKVTTIRRQDTTAMFRLLERRQARPLQRSIELTPQVLVEARNKFEAALRRTAARQHTRYGEAGLPEMFGPHWHGLDAPIATLPAPRVI